MPLVALGCRDAAATEPYLTHRLATVKHRRSLPRHVHGRPTVGLCPRGTTLFSSPAYGVVTAPFSRLTPCLNNLKCMAGSPGLKIARPLATDGVLLARQRAGHTPLLKAYANLLDPCADPLCPLCKEEPQTIELWLRRCPRLDATRQNISGSPSPPVKVFTTVPERVLALTRVTLG